MIMSVCDVPLCPNLSVGDAPPLMGAPKGVPRVNKPTNETRDRLRIRLHKRKETLQYDLRNGNTTNRMGTPSPELADKTIKLNAFRDSRLTAEDKPIQTMIKKVGIEPVTPQLCAHVQARHISAKPSTECKTKVSHKDEQEDENISRDKKAQFNIDDIMKYIEGKEPEVIEEKKAAKKARQRLKKEEARRIKEAEEEARRKAEELRIKEEKRKEDERLKAEMLARAAALRKTAKKNKNQQQNASLKSKKKNKKKDVESTDQQELLEETIPAMVTIKRIVENNNSPPTVTITLKGSTPDQDKLLYTLVNGHNNPTNTNSERVEMKNNKKRNKKVESITTNELKVTLAVDKSFRKELVNKNEKKKKVRPVSPQQNKKEDRSKETVIDIPSLKLPPGITITKVNGPLTNKKSSNSLNSEYQNVPVNKSGVIVVDTEKLIQQSNSTKKNKKKKKKGAQVNQAENQANLTKEEQPMVTLKNPIFHRLQNNVVTPAEPLPHVINMNEQATISRAANGMVTIRRPRHVANESPEFLTPVVPATKFEQTQELESTLSDERKIIKPPFPRPTQTQTGIQITKVNKQQQNVANEIDLSKQMADVSISSTNKRYNFDREDLLYESVFTPKDDLEEELDADERELEAFKRFCQQSIPPKHKEKVAHLNVKDIVLMKKNDVTYS